MGPTQFIRCCQEVATLLTAMGFFVMQAPGEAEATCAALCTAGLVDGVASFDGDTLLFGAEVVYPVVQLSTTQEKRCSIAKCTLEAIRNKLGLTAPGSGRRALGLFAVLCGCDYDESGARGIGGVGAMALVKKLLSGCTDDKTVLDRFESLLNSEPDATLASFVRCTGCLQCKHESGHDKQIKIHSARNNPCPCCPPAAPSTIGSGSEFSNRQNQGCIPQSGECQCAFHRTSNDRSVERFAAKARAEPNIAQRARDTVAVYLRGAEEAAHAVEDKMRERTYGIPPGGKLTWLHRPNVQGVYEAITSLQELYGRTTNGALNWDLSTLRSKMIPALMEWDMRHPPSHATNGNITSTAYSFGPGGVDTSGRNRQGNNTRVEFLPTIIKKIQGSGVLGTQWRYLVEFERVSGVDIEDFGTRLQPLKSNSKSKGAGTAAAADILLSSQNGDESYLCSPGDFGTQRPIGNAEGIDVGVFDGQWLASDVGKSHRGVRMSLIREKWPELEEAFVAKGVRATPATARKGAGTGDVRIEKQRHVASTPARPRYHSLLETPTIRSTHQEKEKLLEEPELDVDEEDFPSSSKKHRSTTPADRIILPGNDNGNGSVGRVVPESENLKTIKSLVKMKEERELAQAARLERLTEEERAAHHRARIRRSERTRQRGGEVGRLFAAEGTGGQNATTTAAAAAGAATEQEEEEEVIDLVSLVSSSSVSEDEDEEEKEHIRTSPQPALPRRSCRNRRQNTEREQDEEIVIDLTGDLSE